MKGLALTAIMSLSTVSIASAVTIDEGGSVTGTGVFLGSFSSVGTEGLDLPETQVPDNWYTVSRNHYRVDSGSDSIIVHDSLPGDERERIFAGSYQTDSGEGYRWGLWHADSDAQDYDYDRYMYDDYDYQDGYRMGYEQGYYEYIDGIIYDYGYENSYGDGINDGAMAGHEDAFMGVDPIDFVDVSFTFDRYGFSENSIEFLGNSFTDQAKGERFTAGSISYTNGVAFLGTAPDSFYLTLFSFGDSADFQQELQIEIAIGSTPNSYSDGSPRPPEEAADYIYFPEFPEFGRLMVFEGETGTVDIMAEFNSLHFGGFGNVSTPGVAFLTPTPGLAGAVPEPSSLLMFFLGSLGVFRFKKSYK